MSTEFNCSFPGDEDNVRIIEEFWRDIRLLLCSKYGLAVTGEILMRSSYCYLLILRKDPNVSNYKQSSILRRCMLEYNNDSRSQHQTRWVNVWDSLPYSGSVGIEFPLPNVEAKGFSHLLAREGLPDVILPLMIGENLFGQSQILDLGKMSHLFIVGGDTYAQGQLLCPLFSLLSRLPYAQPFKYAFLDGTGVLFDIDLPKQCLWDGMTLHRSRDIGVDLWFESAIERLGFVRDELEKRRMLLEERGFSRFNLETGNKAPHIIVFVVDVPKPGQESYDAYCKYKDVIFTFLEENTEKYGVHFVFVDFEMNIDFNEHVLEAVRGEVGTDIRIGTIARWESNRIIAAQDIGLPEAGFACNGDKIIYRTPYNDIHRIRLPKECM